MEKNILDSKKGENPTFGSSETLNDNYIKRVASVMGIEEKDLTEDNINTILKKVEKIKEILEERGAKKGEGVSIKNLVKNQIEKILEDRMKNKEFNDLYFGAEKLYRQCGGDKKFYPKDKKAILKIISREKGKNETTTANSNLMILINRFKKILEFFNDSRKIKGSIIYKEGSNEEKRQLFRYQVSSVSRNGRVGFSNLERGELCTISVLYKSVDDFLEKEGLEKSEVEVIDRVKK